MDAGELLRRVRKIEIKSRGLSNQIFSGEYHSAFKGRGMAFSEVREYTPGDEIRTIDWNVTARFNHPYVKVFHEERELTAILLVDVSASGIFGSVDNTKQERLTELCAVLSFSAIQNNDKVGVIFFSDKIEKFIPPKKGKTHILRIIRELISFSPSEKGTDIAVALRYLMQVVKKRAMVFLMSDFYDDGYEKVLRIASNKHDIIALRITDPHEIEIPDLGLLPVEDAETSVVRWIDTTSPAFRETQRKRYRSYAGRCKTIMNSSGVDYTVIKTDQDYVIPLRQLFKQRSSKR